MDTFSFRFAAVPAEFQGDHNGLFSPKRQNHSKLLGRVGSIPGQLCRTCP